ncbi:hypothetical protein LIER_16693 [Lithospermum erythrorhizon]|uniref:Uncharacterized protein n=1 Tax=Lithospermum erythrorhizon TaxID=34254 RepID=A0AAV3Q7M3_LITER
MDAYIINELLGCRLTEEEATPVELVEEDLLDGIAECEASVYVKVHSHRNPFISTQGFNLSMSRAWNCKGIRVSKVRGSLLQVYFPDEKNEGENNGECSMVF